MTDIDTNGVPVLRVTDAALAMVLEARSSEAARRSLALWVEISGSRRGRLHLRHVLPGDRRRPPEDWSDERGGMALVVPSDSIEKMRGAVLDVSQGGMVIENPNHPPDPGPPARRWRVHRPTSVAT